MTFRNDMANPVVIRSYTGNGLVRFDIWGVGDGRTALAVSADHQQPWDGHRDDGGQPQPGTRHGHKRDTCTTASTQWYPTGGDASGNLPTRTRGTATTGRSTASPKSAPLDNPLGLSEGQAARPQLAR